MIPGEVIVREGEIDLNAGVIPLRLTVSNQGDRPIQIGSHYHFFECNQALAFNRKLAYGCRLNIAAGTAMRFEPGQEREVELIPYRGKRRVFGFQAAVMGELEPA